MFIEGDTVTGLPLKFTGFQVKERAPRADNIADPPGQIAVGEALADNVGFPFTTSATVAELPHPAELPSTV